MFEQQVAWITGASSGIGAAMASELSHHGAKVVLSGRREDRLAAVAQSIETNGGEALIAVCDVRDEAQQKAAVDAAVRQFGQLDVAIANAGFAVGGRVEDLSAEEWRRQLDTNVTGAALTARFAIPELRKTGGRIGLIGSVAAFLPAPGFAAYHCSKHAVRALGLTLSAELTGSGVTCTTVHPGFVESEINQVDNAGVHDPNREEKRPRALMWPTEKAARVIVRAIAKRKRELVFTGHGRVAAWLGMHFPGLAHAVMTSGQMRRKADTFQVD